MIEENEKKLLKSLYEDVYALYPDPKDANLIIAGIILSSRLFLKNCEVLEKAGLLSEDDSADVKNLKIMQTFIIGSKTMFETFASGTLETLLEQIIKAMKKEEDNNGT